VPSEVLQAQKWQSLTCAKATVCVSLLAALAEPGRKRRAYG
jgi:hypothetical protein